MRYLSFAAQLLLTATGVLATIVHRRDIVERYYVTPKIFIISMFPNEGGAWYGNAPFDLLAVNITVPGLSPLYPQAHCTANGDICQLITGEAEINAAASISSLVNSPSFNLTSTYFLIAGIAGGNPGVVTLGSVTFARYAVEVALQYEFDAREIPANFSTAYVPQGSTSPTQYPQSLYGTEVFEVNDNLRQLAAGYARTACLNDSAAAIAYRANYASTPAYAAGAAGPSVVECDVATSDVYYSGNLLSQAFGNYTMLVTNGSGIYCTTGQEDNATLEALLRGAVSGLVDFARIIVMRTVSDFDRPYAGESDIYNLFYADQGGFDPAIQNIYLAGIRVVDGILGAWNTTFAGGVNASNYVGDIFGTLGGTPDFGPGSQSNDNPVIVNASVVGKRAVRRRGLPVMVGV